MRVSAEHCGIHRNRFRDVLECLFSKIGELHFQLVPDPCIDHIGNADTSRVCKRLETGSNVDAVSMDVVALDNDVTGMDANTQIHPLGCGLILLAAGPCGLDFDSGLDGA